MANVRGLTDLKEENDDEKRQAYYTGGNGPRGGGSGQEVLDPRDFMERARNEMGAQTVDEWQGNHEASSANRSFSGAGRALNSSEDTSVPDDQQQIDGPREHTITFYQNGFTVDDGPLRTMDDPANAAFLTDVNRGQMPEELMGTNPNGDGDVHVIDRSSEPYKPPPVTVKPFQGEGRSMKSGADTSKSSSDAPTAAQLSVDEGKPATTLQIRLHDGSRKVVKANHSHTLLQLVQHIATFTPGVAFELGIAFPRRTLTDQESTLEQLGLLNETLVQTLR